MDYTNEQYELMELFADGIIIYDLTDRQKQVMSYLDGEKLLQHRAYIQDGYCELSEHGKRVLEAHRRRVRADEVQTQKEMDALLEKESVRQENIRKEQAKEQKERDRLNREESRNEADRKAEHSFQYKLSLMNAFLNFFLMFISGVLVGNLDRITPLIVELAERFFS